MIERLEIPTHPEHRRYPHSFEVSRNHDGLVQLAVKCAFRTDHIALTDDEARNLSHLLVSVAEVSSND